MIPKIIHYIWLGGKELPSIAKKCIKSWEKFCPDWEIKRWDETNLDLEKYSYVKQAIQCKDYAFASDVLRLDILNKFGGIYLDIDVEMIKPFDDFLHLDSFTGIESGNLINPGLVYGSIPNTKHLQQLLEHYETRNYLENGKKNQITICEISTKYFESKGFQRINCKQEIEGITIFPQEYFSPYDTITSKLRVTENTHSIHWFNASWYSKRKKVLKNFKKFLNIISFGLFGKLIYKKNKT